MKVGGKGIRVEGRFIRIARLEAEGFEFVGDPDAALKALRESGVRVDLFTFTQSLPNTSPKYGYPIEWHNVAALPVSTFDHWWKHQINDKTRNMVRRAEKKGVTVREVPFDDALVEGISAIYNESPIRQGKPFWHYGKDLETVRRENGTFLDRSVFLGAFLGQCPIGFVKLVIDEGQVQAGLMQIVSMIRHRDRAPTNALIAQAVRSCAERGIPFLVYSKFAYGNKQRDSLSDFKQHNGFQRIDLPRYYVPLTRAGWVALRLGLHHRLADHIPEPVLAQLRKLRSLRHSRRFHVAKEPV
ncbi:MAG: hypothetical protein E6K65_09540 [Nitrospirae bacterium]|nr:MAG: hypothetical protein E6K65_09540 [Nitrospirota bacterium]